MSDVSKPTSVSKEPDVSEREHQTAIPSARGSAGMEQPDRRATTSDRSSRSETSGEASKPHSKRLLRAVLEVEGEKWVSERDYDELDAAHEHLMGINALQRERVTHLEEQLEIARSLAANEAQVANEEHARAEGLLEQLETLREQLRLVRDGQVVLREDQVGTWAAALLTSNPARRPGDA